MKKASTLSLFQIMKTYKTEAHAVKYFETMRWGAKPICVKCGGTDKIKQQKNKKDYWCGACRSYFNAFTNTPLHRAKVDIRKWLYASYLLMTARKGISSLQLSKEIDVKQPTAWYMLHRLRLACEAKREALKGVVEVDETYIGGLEKNKHRKKKLKAGRGAVGKVAVVGIRERGGNVRAMVIDRPDSETLQGAIKAHVEQGATVYTDDHGGYLGLEGYTHQTVKHSAKQYVNGMAHTNGIESVWAVIKRGYNGVYHNFSRKHLSKYINEFSFRLNDGNCKIDTQERLNSLFTAMQGKTITYKQLIAG